jgi:hypothetical protein
MEYSKNQLTSKDFAKTLRKNLGLVDKLKSDPNLKHQIYSLLKKVDFSVDVYRLSISM